MYRITQAKVLRCLDASHWTLLNIKHLKPRTRSSTEKKCDLRVKTAIDLHFHDIRHEARMLPLAVTVVLMVHVEREHLYFFILVWFPYIPVHTLASYSLLITLRPF